MTDPRIHALILIFRSVLGIDLCRSSSSSLMRDKWSFVSEAPAKACTATVRRCVRVGTCRAAGVHRRTDGRDVRSIGPSVARSCVSSPVGRAGRPSRLAPAVGPSRAGGRRSVRVRVHRRRDGTRALRPSVVPTDISISLVGRTNECQRSTYGTLAP